MSIERIDEAQRRLVEASRAILAKAEAEDRELTDEEVGELERTTAEVERLDKQRAVVERFHALAAGEAPGANRRTAPGRLGGERGGPLAWGAPGYQPRADSPARALFGALGDMGGFRDAAEFFAVVASGRYDPRLVQAAGGHRTTEGELGGVFVPIPVMGGILDDTVAASALLGRVRRVGVAGKHAVIPTWDNHDRSASTLAGFRGEWLGEGQEGTLQVGKAGQISVVLNKLAIFTKASNELLEDSGLFVREFQPALAAACAYSFDRAILRGTGVGQPLGWFNDPAAVTVPKEAGQPADTISFGNVVRMFAAMYPAGVRRAVWVVHPSAVPQLLTMKDLIRTVDGSENVGGAPVVTMGNAGEMTLLGRPVVQSEHAAQLGDEGDIIFADPSQHAVFLRSDLRLETSRETFWMSDEVGFRLIWRATGQGLWASAATRPGDAQPSESWLVRLAARA